MILSLVPGGWTPTINSTLSEIIPPTPIQFLKLKILRTRCRCLLKALNTAPSPFPSHRYSLPQTTEPRTPSAHHGLKALYSLFAVVTPDRFGDELLSG